MAKNERQLERIRKAALKLLQRAASDPTELEIWGCPPCAEYPYGLEGLAKQSRDQNRKCNRDSNECDEAFSLFSELDIFDEA